MPGSNKKDEYKEQNKQEQQNQQEETEVKLNTVKASGDDLEDDPNDTEAERERKRKERQLRMEKQARDAAYWDEFTRQRVEKDEKITQIKIERFQRSVEETHEMLTHAGGLIQDSEPGNNPNQNAPKTYDYGLSDLEEQERKCRKQKETCDSHIGSDSYRARTRACEGRGNS